MKYEKAIATMWNSNDPVVKALVVSGYNLGKYFDNDTKEEYLQGSYVDAYLLTIVLAWRIAAGDIEIIEKNDSTKSKEYFDKLLQSCAQLNIKAEQEKE